MKLSLPGLQTILIGLVLLPGIQSQASERLDSLALTARRSLEQNIVQLPSGPYLAAGANQFRTLWTRDFAFASRGLLAMGRGEVVRNHLTRLLENRRPSDGLVPRVMDSMSTRVRVSLSSLSRVLPFPWQSLPLEDPLVAEYVDEHGTEAIDSNALVLKAALDYLDRTGDLEWWSAHESELAELYRFYDRHRDEKDGLIVQAAYSDWQDSVKREGKAFYSNLLYFAVSARLVRFPAFGIHPETLPRLRESIDRTFFEPETGVYRSLAGLKFVSLDGNLLAIDLGYVTGERAIRLYADLKLHPVWKGGAGLPGSNTYPDYPRKWNHLAAKIVRIGHYHDRLYWSWLMALSAKIARIAGDIEESDRVISALAAVAARDGAIGEVYQAEVGLPLFETCLYRSETPFSWGAGFVLDLVESLGPVNREDFRNLSGSPVESTR